MVSVMAIVSEVFGSSVEKIDASVGVGNGDALLCCGWNYLGYVLAGKVAQYLRWGWVMVRDNGGRSGCFGSD